MSRHRVGASSHNVASWPGFNSAIHKGADLCRKNGGGRFSITCFTPGLPRYAIDSWDRATNKRTNEETVWMGRPYRNRSFDNLPKWWIKLECNFIGIDNEERMVVCQDS